MILVDHVSVDLRQSKNNGIPLLFPYSLMEFIVSGIYKWFKLVLIAALLSQHGFAMTNPIKCDGHDTSESHMSSNDSLSSVEHTTLNNHTLHSEKNQDVQHCEGNDQSICACCIGAYCATSLTQFCILSNIEILISENIKQSSFSDINITPLIGIHSPPFHPPIKSYT